MNTMTTLLDDALATVGQPDGDAALRATFALVVNDEPGVLHRIVGLFAARGYNIESLTVAQTGRTSGMSRVTIVTAGTPQVLRQIRTQLEKMISAHEVRDLTSDPSSLLNEMALVTVEPSALDRPEALRIATLYRAAVIDMEGAAIVFEVTGRPSRIDGFVETMEPLGLVEVSRTGALAIVRRGAALVDSQ